MKGYSVASLKMMIDNIGEERVKTILSDFCCPLNKDVEGFLRSKAIEFAKQGIAATHLVFASKNEEMVLIGYFSIANKFFTVNKCSKLSSTLRKRVNRFGSYNEELKRYEIVAPLIAQLGKNYANGYNELISGEELLKMACDKVKEVQAIVGGKIVYLECEEKSKLIEFYTRCGFVAFDKRMLDRDEKDSLSGTYLIQMMKYMV